MIRLALGSIRGRVAGFSGAVLAIVFAASLIVACGVLIESAIRSDLGGSTRFEAASAIVKARPTLETPPDVAEVSDYSAPELPPIPASLVEEIGAVSGVQSAVGDVSFYAQAIDPAGDPLANESGGPSVGHAWSSANLTPFTLQVGREPVDSGDVVLDADLARRGGYDVGDAVPVVLPAGVETFSLSGIAAPPGKAGLEEQSTVFFSEETARALAPSPDEFGIVGILANPSTDAEELRALLSDELDRTRFDVLTGDGMRDAEQFPHQILPSSTTEFLGTASGLTGFVTIFIVANTFSFSVQQRGREIGLLRAVGAEPRQIMRLIVGEAAIVALLGSVLGSVLGLVLAWPLRWALIQVKITSPDMAVVYGPIPIIAAVVSSLVIAEIAVMFAARRAARIQPSAALREASIERRRIGILRFLFGLLLGIGGLVGFYFVVQVGGEAGAALTTVIVMSLCIAGALLGPALVWPVGWIVGTILARAGGVTGLLARSNVLANRRRSSSVAVPLMLTACFATLFLFIGGVQEYGVSNHTRNRLTSDYVVVSSASPGLPPSAAVSIQDLPEVSIATGTLPATVVMNITPIGSEYSDLTDVSARGVDPEPLVAVLNLNVTDGSLAGLRDDSQVAISDLVARGRNLDVGDEATIWLPDGTRITPRVAAIYTNSMGFADILLPREILARHTSEQLDAETFVSIAPDVSVEQFRMAVEELSGEIPTLQVIERQAYTELLNEEIRANTRVTYLLAALAAIYTAIAIINTLMMSISERAREFARLRMIGSTHRQVVTMVVWETAIIVALGAGLGVGISLLANMGFSAGLFGERQIIIPWPGFIAVLAGVLALGFGASIIPAWLASRSNPSAASGTHE